MKKIISLFMSLFIFCLSNSIYSQWSILNAEADSIVLKGSNHIYNLEFIEAEKCFFEVQNKYPVHPAGYFLDAMITWWKILIDKNNSDSYKDAFLSKIEKTINICDKLLDSNSSNINALFFKGGAIGYRARYYADIESWINAAKDASEAFDILKRCLKIAPSNHDIMLGTGIYNYFAEAIPEKYPIVRPLLLFLPSGDKKIGELLLKSAAKNARYSNVEAKVALMQIYYSFESNNWEALNIVRELHQKYPDNPYFKKYYGRLLVRTGNYSFEECWREILRDCIAKKFGYQYELARESMYYIALALIRKKDYDMALKYLYKCDEGSRVIDKSKTSSFMIMANLWMGKIYDLQEKRNYAIKQYEKVLKMDNYFDSHSDAKKFIASPYK